jgi:DNA-binding IclR family transcriptional regulator
MPPFASLHTGYRAPAVQKAFRLLEAVAEARGAIGLSELAQRLGFSKSTTHGLIHGLLRVGALEQAQRRRGYFLGPLIIELAFHGWNLLQLGETAQPELNALRDRIGETVFLGVLSRRQAVIVARAEANKPLKISSPPGTTLPLLAGAVGKIFLAGLDEHAARVFLRNAGLPRFTAKSPVDAEAYLREIAGVRDCGYAVDKEEYLPGVRAVAAGLGNRRGLPLAVWVVGFAGALPDETLLQMAQATCKAALQLRQLIDNAD